METFVLTIRGTKPLLMNNPTSMRPSDVTTTRADRKPTPEDEAKAKAYWCDGQLAFPANAVRSALLNASVGHKIGRRSAKAVLAGAIIDVLSPSGGEWLLLTDHDGRPLTTYEIDLRRAVVQRNAVLRARPRLDQWQARVAIIYDPEFIQEKEIEIFVKRAGITVGIGDWRPEKNGTMGRFEILAHA